MADAGSDVLEAELGPGRRPDLGHISLTQDTFGACDDGKHEGHGAGLERWQVHALYKSLKKLGVTVLQEHVEVSWRFESERELSIMFQAELQIFD